jgi:hypothetical protein
VRLREAKDSASGTSSSWASRELKLSLGCAAAPCFVWLTSATAAGPRFVLELRGKFTSPCYEIEPLGREVLAAVLALARELEQAPPALSLDQRALAWALHADGRNGESRWAGGAWRLWVLAALAAVAAAGRARPGMLRRLARKGGARRAGEKTAGALLEV